MTKILVNLLPAEFKIEQIKRAKFYKIQTVGVAIILFLVFLSSLTIALRILQTQQILKSQIELSQTEQKISDLKNTQASLLLLKNRLVAINQYLGNPSKQAQMFNLINELLPVSVFVNSIAVDKDGGVLVLAITRDSNSLDETIDNLISQQRNQDKISQVSVESLGRGKDGIYRLSFKIKPK